MKGSVSQETFKEPSQREDAKKTVKQLATKGDVKSARILAREVVRVDRQKDRMSVSKARLGSINYQLQQQLGE